MGQIHNFEKVVEFFPLCTFIFKMKPLTKFTYCSTTAVIAPDAVVCDEATLEGDITIGPRCVVHPKAMLIAKDGPIVLGAGNLIEEYAKIVNR